MCNKFLMGSRFLIIVSVFTFAGCSQMARHSNTLVFSTNTTIGVNVGQDVNQTPKAEIGYNRQELALVPVLANTEVAEGNLNPCPKEKVQDCLFQASHDGEDKDSYSTVASFGGKSGAEGAEGKAEVAVAQYFATGIAAQQLVLSGGANIVQAGGDTKAKAKAAEAAAGVEKSKLELKIEKEKANAAVYGDDMAKGRIAAKTILGDKAALVDQTKRADLANKIGGVGCGDAFLKTLDQTTVENFLVDLKKNRFQCLARLGKNVEQ